MKTTDDTFQFFSETAKYEYTIRVYVPPTHPPKDGFPIIYVLDGLSYFEYAKQVIKLQSQNTPKTFIQPSIIVGICHNQEDMRQRRFFDFTAPAQQYIIPDHAKGKRKNPGEYGGALQFHLFMEVELKPFINGKFAVNEKQQTIYGHSLAGYYTLWNILTYNSAFHSYIAISPSIWWNSKELFHYLKKAKPLTSQKLFIAAGEQEGFMVEDAKTFFNDMKLHTKELYIAIEENHASVVPATISRAFRFLNR